MPLLSETIRACPYTGTDTKEVRVSATVVGKEGKSLLQGAPSSVRLELSVEKVDVETHYSPEMGNLCRQEETRTDTNPIGEILIQVNRPDAGANQALDILRLGGPVMVSLQTEVDIHIQACRRLYELEQARKSVRVQALEFLQGLSQKNRMLFLKILDSYGPERMAEEMLKMLSEKGGA